MMKTNYLFAGLLFSIILFSCHSQQQGSDTLAIENHEITVDGETADWKDVPGTTVQTEDHLWCGEGLPQGAWTGKDDLSYTWKTAWNDGKLFFLFEVIDDTLSNFDQEYAWLNDCIEIYVDPHKLGGERITGIGSDNTLEDRVGREMRGYEMQFLPSDPPKVYVDDSKGIYFTDTDQNELYKEEWKGEVVAKKTSNGYLMEMAFTTPGARFDSGREIGVDVGICDDDGAGRKSLLLWSGYKGEFWLTMDNFKSMRLK